MKKAVIYLLAFTVAEVVTVVVHPMWGMVCHVVVLAVVIAHSAIASERRYRELFLSLALVPLIRIVSLSMPLANIPQLWWYPIIYAPLLVAAFVVVRMLGYRVGEVGLNFRALPIQLAVSLSGFLFGVAEYFILRKPQPAISEFVWQDVWLMALIFLTCTGFVEEFIFRGVLQRSTEGVFGRWSIIYVSVVFAVAHFIHYAEVGLLGVLADVAFVFVVAMFFGWVVRKTGSLLGVSLAHGITNTILYLVAPFFL